MPFRETIDKLSFHPKKLFLIDGLGAAYSTFMLGVVLIELERFFGIPQEALYFLAFFPGVFAAYDFYCYWRVKQEHRFYLRLIAAANLLYCGISLGVMLYHHQKLTYLGWTYIVLEIVVVAGLAFIERKTANAIGRINE